MRIRNRPNNGRCSLDLALHGWRAPSGTSEPKNPAKGTPKGHLFAVAWVRLDDLRACVLSEFSPEPRGRFYAFPVPIADRTVTFATRRSRDHETPNPRARTRACVRILCASCAWALHVHAIRIIGGSRCSFRRDHATLAWIDSGFAMTTNKKMPTGCLVALVIGGFLAMLMLFASLGIGAWFLFGADALEALKKRNAPSKVAVVTLSAEQSIAILRSRSSAPDAVHRAIASLRTRAADGDASVMFVLATAYQSGIPNGHPDLADAFRWFQKAADAGNAHAMVQVAQYYQDGVWVNKNDRVAQEWLGRAAKAGSAEAKWLLAQGVAP